MTTLSPFHDGIYLRANPHRTSARGYPLPAKECRGHRGRPQVLVPDPELGDRCFACGHAPSGKARR